MHATGVIFVRRGVRFGKEKRLRLINRNAVGGDYENIVFDLAQSAFECINRAAQQIDHSLSGFFLQVVEIDHGLFSDGEQIDYFAHVVVRFRVINIDARSAGQAAVRILIEIEVKARAVCRSCTAFFVLFRFIRFVGFSKEIKHR